MSIKKVKTKDGKTKWELERMISGNRYHQRFDTKKECELFEKSLIEFHTRDHRRFTTYEGTLSDVINEYFEINKIKFSNKKSTERVYRNYANIILNDPIARRKFLQIDYVSLQKFFNGLCERYSKKTVSGIRTFLGFCYKLAIKNGYLERNLVSLVEIHKPAKEEDPNKKYIPPAVFDKIIDTMQSRNESLSFSNYCIALMICYYSGTRISEALALQWKDFDSVNATLNINKQIYSRGKRENFYVTGLKTPASKAVLPIPQILVDTLKEWRLMNMMTSEDEGLIVSYNGEPIAYNAIWAVFKRACASIGIDHTLHDLRASYITNLLLAGCDIKTLQALARHENIEVTLSFYAESTPEMLREAVDTAFSYPITQELHNDKMRTS